MKKYKNEYGVFTVGMLKKLLTEYSKDLKGDDTPVYTGDFECNCTHSKHLLMTDENIGALVLTYEMHENVYEEI